MQALIGRVGRGRGRGAGDYGMYIAETQDENNDITSHETIYVALHPFLYRIAKCL